MHEFPAFEQLEDEHGRISLPAFVAVSALLRGACALLEPFGGVVAVVPVVVGWCRW